MQTHKQSLIVSGLSLIALALMVVAFFTPIWWVSLTAPNYPKDAFPEGIRLHFFFTGVENGCQVLPKTNRIAQETQQEDLGWRTDEGAVQPADKGGVDCVNEMNTINHYVGMKPIGVGAPVERLLSRYIVAIFAVMLVGFAIGPRKIRTWALAGGFVAVSAWTLIDLYVVGRAATFGAQYMTDAAKYFNEAERIRGWGHTLSWVTALVVGTLIAVMVFTVFASARWPKFQLVLAVVPALLPGFFVLAFAAWLGFYGHNMHPWGAFTLKPFMPTVFGEGKVAQFSTHSFPHYGFALLAGATVCLLVAALKRRIELLDHVDQPTPAPVPTTRPAPQA